MDDAKTLNIEILNQIHIKNLTELYKQGYKLDEISSIINSTQTETNSLKVSSLKQLVDLHNQGYRISQKPTFDSNGNAIVKMSNGTGLVISLTVVGILWFMFWAFIIYVVGKAEAGLVGLD